MVRRDRFIKAKTLAGDPIRIFWEDLGEGFEGCYSTLFETDHWHVLSMVDKAAARSAPYPFTFRIERDYAALSDRGINCETIEIIEPRESGKALDHARR